MEYPQKFKEEILNSLGNFSELKSILDNYPEVVGQLLGAFASAVITPEEIVRELEKGNSTTILERAKKIVAGKKLYDEWVQLNDSKIAQEPRLESVLDEKTGFIVGSNEYNNYYNFEKNESQRHI